MEENPIASIRKTLNNFGMCQKEWQDLLIAEFPEAANFVGEQEGKIDALQSQFDKIKIMDEEKQDKNQGEQLETLLNALADVKCLKIKPEKYFGFTDTGKVSILPDKVRVIILGESVSPNLTSLGYAFGTKNRPSPSLETLCDCIERDFGLKTNLHPSGRLDGWISQGVLLMNVNIVGQKEERFQKIVEAILRGLLKRNDKMICLVFGMGLPKKVVDSALAQFTSPPTNVLQMFHPNKKNYIDKPPHFTTSEQFANLFYNKKPFFTANEWLKAINEKEIDWCQFEIK